MARTLLLLFFISTLTFSYSQDNWELLSPKGTISTYRDVHMYDANHGFSLTDWQLFETSDGGDTWDLMLEFSGARKMEFLDNTGYIVGMSGMVLRTTDRGSSWETLNTGITDNLNSISFLDATTVVLGGSGGIHSTSDGGANWQSLAVTLPGYQESILTSHFRSVLVGHLIGSSGNFFKTDDGGVTWRITQPAGTYQPAIGVFGFIDDNIGYASGDDIDLYKTEDGGESWTLVPGMSGDSFYVMEFLDENNGYIAGELGVLFRTVDGGATWEWASFTTGRTLDRNIHGLSFIDAQTGIAAGQGGRIARTFDAGENWEFYATFHSNISQLDFLTDSLGYVLTNNTFYKTIDRGKTWENIGGPDTSPNLVKFDFLTPVTGYAIGGYSDRNKVYRTTDGGLTWTEKFVLFYDDFYSIDFVNENLGFVGGGFNSRGIFRTTDGGDNWEQVLDQSVGTIQFLNENVGYARRVGNAIGQIYKTIDGGTTWSIVYQIEEFINSLFFLDEDTGFLVGDEGLMKKTSDGGATWQDIGVPYDYYAYVKFYSEALGYIVQEDGRIYVTQDGGSSWEVVRFLPGLRSVEFTEDQSIYLAGGGGIILRSSLPSKTLDPDEFTITTFNESCYGQTDGQLNIDAKTNATYIAVLNGEEYPFENQLILNDLSPGTYELCLSLRYWESSKQCYEFTIEPAFTFEASGLIVEGATSKNSLQIEIQKGTAPYSLMVNKQPAATFSGTRFELGIQDGDLVEVATAKPCEGVFTFEVPRANKLVPFPIPASTEVTVRVATTRNQVKADLFDAAGNLIRSKDLSVEGNSILIPVYGLAPGVYIAVLHLENPQTIRIIKK